MGQKVFLKIFVSSWKSEDIDLKILNLDIPGKPKLIEFKAYIVLGKPVNPKICFCHQPQKLLLTCCVK